MLLDIPTILVKHNAYYKLPDGKLFRRLIVSKIDKILIVSEGIRDSLINQGVSNTKIRKINNFINIKRIKKKSKECLNDFQFCDKNFYICTISRFAKTKALDLLLRSFARLKTKDKYDNVKLVILGGNGTEKNEITRLIRKNQIKDVSMLGFKLNPYKYLKMCDLFVLASYFEGFPLSILEAMVLGCPVVSTDTITGPREILADEDDYYIDLESNVFFAEYGVITSRLEINRINKNQANHLVSAFERIIDSKILREKYKSKSLQRSKRYSLESSIHHYLDLISEILAKESDR
jgi:N-acetylgalactosamine-N,N'-diacetylbacillosaminyl-diphospho-undecaprenol 4-alpha-N-acetylgalactosaminyltransferase